MSQKKCKKKQQKIFSCHNHLLAVAANSLYPPDNWGPAFVRSLPTSTILLSWRALPPPKSSLRRRELLSLYFGRQHFFFYFHTYICTCLYTCYFDADVVQCDKYLTLFRRYILYILAFIFYKYFYIFFICFLACSRIFSLRPNIAESRITLVPYFQLRPA